ncbi:MAG TPA: MDR family MFS transporter [Candidatus Dormibacteraeota bacterium]|jgi:EmrB/QacA subfamily drug resistance transporter|nr:MDR family MFS transporter [Candidatus Dormibacteraeota bacterium]
MADAAIGSAPTAVAGRTKAVIMVAVLLVLFLSSLDQTVVGTALPRIVTDLKGTNLYTWVVTAYLLTSTVTVPVYGKLSDAYGRKPMLLFGVVVFLCGSALSGLSQTMPELIGFRALQGIGAGALFPVSLAIIGDLFTPRERGRYQGLFGAVFGISFIIGPFLGGVLTDDVSWRWVFYVNLPVGILALAVIAAVLPSLGRRAASIRDLDFLGIIVFTIGVVPLLIGLTDKGEADSSGRLYGWTSWEVGGLIIFGLIALVVFVVIESRAREPIVPLDLFRNRTYAATMVAVLLLGFGMFAAVIYMPRFYQVVRGVDATRSGYEIWTLLVGLMGGSILAGQLISRFGRYKVLLAVSMVFLGVGAFLLLHLTASTSNPVLWSWLLILGLGLGPGMAGYTVVVQAAVPVSRMGVATSTLTFFRQIGGSIGLAIAGTIFNSVFIADLPKQMEKHGVPAAVATRIASGTQATQLSAVGNAVEAILKQVLPAQFQPFIPGMVSGIHDAVALAIGSLSWLTLAAAVAGLLCVLLLRELPLPGGPSLRQERTASEEKGEVPVAHF